jgi:hypothetical protein
VTRCSQSGRASRKNPAATIDSCVGATSAADALRGVPRLGSYNRAVTIGVMCAIPQELAHLRGVLSGSERHEIAQITFDVGELDGHRVVLAAAGMGKVISPASTPGWTSAGLSTRSR